MGTIIEVTQTECECRALLAQQNTSYNIKAKVELISAIGRRLVITINPPLNSISEAQLVFDGSKLPEDMVVDWLMETLTSNQILSKYEVVSSNKEEHEVIINN